ncbi:General secretion pathway protein A [hydrothermal vent metagenome]|uniref:General secretion pathway protein A n=1 Tax=hydrothermal vent metagenome TaxID=652676 RepID=A0A3B0Z506_9ZZZZ
MYSDYFGLSAPPFAITPDPRYLFMSKRHQEALAHLIFGIKEGGGFVQLTGEVGTGKTTLIRALLEQLDKNVDVALILNPRLTAFEFVASLCDDLHIVYPLGTSSMKVLVGHLNDFLLQAHAQGRRVILIVDEAQNFQADVLEQIRLLTNLETSQQKLLQIILVGQPELRDLLSTVNMRQLAQRVTARYHLIAMTREESKGYIQHRLRVAGASHPLFSDGAINQITKLSKGVPRLINILCDRALLGAYAKGVYQVKASFVKHAAREVGGKLDLPKSNGKWIAGAGILSVVVLVSLAWQLNMFDIQSKINTWNRFAESEESIQDRVIAVATAKVKPESEQEIDKKDQESYEILSAKDVTIRLAQAAATDLNNVFFSLFARWQLDYGSLSGVSGCDRATSARLRCHWGRSSWAEFVALNRPAIVWFEGEGEAKHYMAIMAIRDDHVQVSVGGQNIMMPLAELKSIWPSEYFVLWRPPALGIKVIRQGDAGEVVLWLRRNLDKIDNVQPSSEEAHIFDRKLMKRIKMFQLTHDLEVDGVVGVRTMMYLNAALRDGSIPFLKKER